MRITFIVLGFPALKRVHIEGRPQNKSTAFFRPEVRQPVPAEDTLAAADHGVPLRRDDPPKRVRGRRPILMNEVRAVRIENTDVHGACR